ncbi:MAG: glycosyltransferase family 39 protein [Bacteroidales bacterium]|nr:glycosyltransferase family 39 protein [Bacteroidales bacterium]
MMRKIYQIILITFAVKIAYVLFAIAYQEHTPQKIDPGDLQSVLDVFKRHDSYWYEKIATFGHEKITPDQLGKCDGEVIEQSYYQFLPLYPAIIGLTMSLTGSGFNSAAFFYSLVFSLAAFILFYIFAGIYLKDERKAFMATLLLILFPFHYYFSMYYTESLFLLLLLGSFIAVHRKQPALLAVLLGFLVLVRPNALFMTIPLFIYYFEKHYSLIPKEIFSRNLREYLPLLAFAAAPLVMLSYGAYLRYMTGDFFAYITARRGWCLYTTFPWEPLLRMQTWEEYFKFFYLVFFGLISLICYRKIPLSMQALIWINLLLPLTSNMITLPRFISCIFIFPLLFGDWTAGWKWPLRLTLAVILFAGQLITFTFWLGSAEFAY